MQKLFTNDKFFTVAMVIAVLGMAVFAIGQCIAAPETKTVDIAMLLSAVCTAVLYISYHKHSKNVMKGMMGALLMAQVIWAVSLFGVVEFFADLIFEGIFLICSVVLFVNHFVINADRESNDSQIKINQFASVILALDYFIWAMVYIPYCADGLALFYNFALAVAYPCMMATIVCIETRLDAYRRNRENAGWTEKEGYPEGYVHEYEKK